MSAPVKGRLSVAGRVEVVAEGSEETYVAPMSILIEFNSPEELRKAIADGACEFSLD